MNTKQILRAMMVGSLVAWFGTVAEAQTPAESNQNEPPSLVQTVQASFRIEPIVHRFTGRRGEVIPFEFEIASLGKSMNLKIFPVNLRQEESGIILHDQEGEPSDAVKLTTPNEFRLAPGESKKIKGVVTIPTAKTNYLSFGILVQDRGQAPKFDLLEGQNPSTKAGIRFVTQYVLRVDIETGHADPREFGKLRLERGTILSSQGLPLVRTYLDNPTDFAFECQVRATIDSKNSGKTRPFFLNMPSRAELEDDGRYLVRIMPKSRLRLESPVDFPIFAGEQTLNVGITNGRREVVGAEFAISLSPDAFPALASQIAYVGEGVAVSPCQIEVGTSRGSRRMLGMKFINNSPVDQSVLLHAKSMSGEAIGGLKISPEKFKIRAGKSKSVRIKIKTLAGESEDSLGEIHVVVENAEGKQAQQSLPLIVRRTERKAPNISISDIQLVRQAGRSAFQLNVKNNGASFVPLSADLEIASTRGRALRLTSGYGRWLPPGAQQTLTFLPDSELPSGEYLLSLAVRTFEDIPAKTKTLSIQLQTQAVETSRKGSDHANSSSKK